MKITVFTSNQRRHLHLVKALAEVGDVFAVQECTTILPGLVPDALYGSNKVMRDYFSRMLQAEDSVFGNVAFSSSGTRILPIQMGDLSKLPLSIFSEALASDLFVVFGASWIKGPLVDALIERGTINIHMGVSPYYRGSSCNFWALYDRRPDLVGATIHLLSRGLDNGGILFHALPSRQVSPPFELGMLAVKAAHLALVQTINLKHLDTFAPVPQNRSEEIRYSRSSEFTDEIAAAYLNDLPTPQMIGDILTKSPTDQYVRPYFMR
jgi:hypothetical protein